jgi:hypothetical protein
MKPSPSFKNDFDRRKFLSSVGKGLGLMALSSTAVGSLPQNIHAATEKTAHLSPEALAADERFLGGNPAIVLGHARYRQSQ